MSNTRQVRIRCCGRDANSPTSVTSVYSDISRDTQVIQVKYMMRVCRVFGTIDVNLSIRFFVEVDSYP